MGLLASIIYIWNRKYLYIAIQKVKSYVVQIDYVCPLAFKALYNFENFEFTF